ncbi:unnamed protein product [Rotaria sordida]|uniref:Uncharacterized protein n=1 Tax=Rotaria sordida TaxID=392033 RepID=A0A813PVD2_9BILA|nr:unnamed protein product [Rotaria sordida]
MEEPTDMESSEDVDPTEYMRLKEEYEDKYEDFMRKHLRRVWPLCAVRLLGVFQLLVTLVILGIDLPIILMFGPRWQLFAGCWASILGFIACVSTIHSSRKMTWSKLKWTAGFNIVAGIAMALMAAFDILYLMNSKICLVISGCHYLWYTYSAVRSFYTGQVVMGVLYLLSVFIFLVLFIKYGIGGTTLFENIQRGWAPPIFDPVVPPNSTTPMPQNPMARSEMMMPPPPPGYIPMPPQSVPGARMMMPPSQQPMPGARMMMPPPQQPMPGARMMMRPPLPPGSMPPYQVQVPGAMMPRPRGPMMMPGGRPLMQGYYGPPVYIEMSENPTNPTRQLITEWIHQEKYNHKEETQRKFYANLAHAKGVLKVAAADSKVNEETRKWVSGYLAAMGVTDEILDLADKYKPNIEDGTVPYHSKSGLEHAKYGQLWIFYDAFCAASAGGELTADKITAIYALAKKMLIDEEKIKEVQQLFEREIELRKKRLEILFPNGIYTAIKEVEMEQ